MKPYDVIVVGARCAGSPTAMLLARKGYKVLVVDRATLPERHDLDAPRSSARRGGAGALGPARPARGDGMPAHRHVRVRFRTVHDLGGARDRRDPGRVRPAADGAGQAARRRRVRGRSRGAGGVHGRGARHRRTVASPASAATARAARPSPSTLAWSSVRTAGTRSSRGPSSPSSTTRNRNCCCGYYSYWSGLPMNGRFEAYIRPDRAFAAWPTNDDLTLVIGGWPFAEFEANKDDIEGNYLQDVRTGAGVRRAGARGQPRSALRRHGGAELLPQAVRTRLGAGRRRRLQQGLHHGPGHPGRLPGRRAVRHGARRGVLGRPILRRRDGRLPVRSRRARPADVRVHLRASRRSSPRRPKCSSCWRRCTAIRKRWTGSRGSTPE